MGRSGQQDDDEIVEGEVVGETDPQTMMNLPPIPEEDEHHDDALSPAPFADASEDETVNNPGRRFMLARILMGGTAALAVGGSAALLLDRRRKEDPTVVILPNGEQALGPESADIATLARQIADLQDQLETVTFERDQLQVEVNALTTEVEDLRARCATSEELNGLWASLDDLGLDDIVSSGLAVVQIPLAAVVRVAGLLGLGLQVGRAAIQSFVNSLPKPRAGMTWLSQQVDRLADALEDLALKLQEAVDPDNKVTAMVTSFVLWLLDKLPFGAGDQAKAGLESMENIVNSLPVLTDGIVSDVITPIAGWFGTDDEESFDGLLFNPIRGDVFQKADDIIEQVATLEQRFNEELLEPVQAALENRQALRQQIAEAQARLEQWHV